MMGERFIQWCVVDRGERVQFAGLRRDVPGRAESAIGPDKEYVVYEYCNLHGLWKTEGKA